MKKINGALLKQMILSGANNLFNCYPEVDALNVFPVPDGDTGTNMNLTISSGAKEVANRNDTNVYDIAKSFSKGLLMGARGNSGVILSQIFRGFAKSLDGKEVMDTLDLADAFVMGKEVAYKAVMRPVEGTILTVIREASDALYAAASSDMSIEDAFEVLLNEARASLKRTPELLPVLKEVGVVDSGGTGLVKILEGFQKAILGNVVEKTMAQVTDATQAKISDVEAEGKEVTYCVELLLKMPSNPSSSGKKVFVEKRFINILQSHGEKVRVEKENDLVRIHVHTNNPGNILSYVQQYGDFLKLKIENLDEAHTTIFEEKKKEDEPLKEYGLIAVAIGKGLENLFKEYRVDYIVSGGQTMNPSTEDFIAAIEKVHAKNIFILPNNSNIIMAASQAAKISKGDIKVHVIPSKTIPQGLTASMMFNPEITFEENIEEMTAALENVKTGQVTFAIKDTSIDGVEVKKDEFIGISDKTIICSRKEKVDAAYEMLKSMIDDMTSIITILVGEGVSEEEVRLLKNKINEEYDDIELDVIDGNQPVYSFIIGVE